MRIKIYLLLIQVDQYALCIFWLKRKTKKPKKEKKTIKNIAADRIT